MRMHQAIRLLKKIPKGRVATYKEMARACETSPRAIGGIMARNAHPIEYPCYKVVASTGALTGYSAPGGIAKKRALLLRDGVGFIGSRVDRRYFHCFSKMLLALLLLPMLSHAQAGSSTLPAASSAPPAIGRTQDIYFIGDVVEVKDDGTLLIAPGVSTKAKTGSAQRGMISVDAGTAQIVKNGRKNAALSSLAAGDRVRIKGKIMPDGSYLAQHIVTISKKPIPIKGPALKKQKAKRKSKPIRIKALHKSK